MNCQKYSKCIHQIVILLVLCLFSTICTLTYCKATSPLKVHFINVGQGDAILIQNGSRNTLIDTGEESEFNQLADYLARKKVKKIHQLIITHPDSDHMGGADFVIEQYNVDTIYLTKYKNSTYEYEEMMAAVASYKVRRKNVKPGQTIRMGKAKARVLAANSSARNSNDSSIVLRLCYGKRIFLFMGDASSSIESELVRTTSVKADVLKVGHHGSGYSSGIQFISKCSPSYAVISVGKDNSYGHPTKYTLSRLARYAKRTFRTDQNGSILLTTDGKKLTCKTETSSSGYQSIPIVSKWIGNRNTKIYHVPGCHSLPMEKNQIAFKNKKEAVSAGYRACKNCCS